MKSSDNTLLLAGLFVLIVVIIALIVYYTRPGETKTSDQTSDTTKLTVENLTFERTLNPDPSVGDGVSGYTIEPYGVEYAGKADYEELSKNVTFTMIWDNAP
jgi:septal ring-binding cell division protein DamX